MLNVEVKHYRPIVGQVSCVGIGHNTFPLNFGNYFWISNGPYIVNFWAENLEEWTRRNPDVNTIEVTVVSDDNGSLGIITDSRMKEWTNNRLCVTGHGWPSMLVLRKVGEITGLDITNKYCGCEQDNESPLLSHSFSFASDISYYHCHRCNRKWQI